MAPSAGRGGQRCGRTVPRKHGPAIRARHNVRQYTDQSAREDLEGILEARWRQVPSRWRDVLDVGLDPVRGIDMGILASQPFGRFGRQLPVGSVRLVAYRSPVSARRPAVTLATRLPTISAAMCAGRARIVSHEAGPGMAARNPCRWGARPWIRSGGARCDLRPSPPCGRLRRFRRAA